MDRDNSLLASYKKRLADANDKIYSLEDQVVALQQQLEKNAPGTTTSQHMKNDMDIKMESDATRGALEATTKHCEQFEEANAALASFIATIENVSGVPASELGDRIKSLQESVSNGSKIETALRTQVNNYQKKIKKAEKNTARMKVELDEAQEKVQKLKADLFHPKVRLKAVGFAQAASSTEEEDDGHGGRCRLWRPGRFGARLEEADPRSIRAVAPAEVKAGQRYLWGSSLS
ncbi:hypothetical protein D0860_00255 [Hortaea werneckii]|uniref:Uncharacterized protein n=1 Tax=Hortaea werneckii TaxID=91943 RepID=A0A3M7HWI7_HORWE|nr:hypothetical protein D0860_00255 [Hortaea werneckii]